MYDIIVIGAGVTGTCIARELSKYQVNMCVIEKGDDVASGTSKANSGVIHAGFDAKPGTLMAKMNVRGNELLYKLAPELDFPVKQNGSLATRGKWTNSASTVQTRSIRRTWYSHCRTRKAACHKCCLSCRFTTSTSLRYSRCRLSDGNGNTSFMWT